MGSEQSDIIFIDGVAIRLGQSIASVRRNLAKARRGELDYPMPVSEKHCKGRWLKSSVDEYLRRKSGIPPPITSTSVAESREERRTFEQKQQLLKLRLEAHRIDKSSHRGKKRNNK